MKKTSKLSMEAKIDLFKCGIKELRDGLTLKRLQEDFPWILKANIKNAIIGLTEDRKLLWYNGVWIWGTWQDGTWFDGDWEYGKWQNGTWGSGTWFLDRAKLLFSKLLFSKLHYAILHLPIFH